MLLSLEQYHQEHHVKKNKNDMKYIQLLQTRILDISRALRQRAWLKETGNSG